MKENSIDIKILKELGREYYKSGEVKIKALSGAKYIMAIEHILSDYKRVLKENENKTEKIENQKNELAILNDKQKDFNKLQNKLNSYEGQFRRQEKEINILNKENEELKYKYDKALADVVEATRKLKMAGIKNCKNRTVLLTREECIPVQKVKDKIEKLEQENKKYGNCLITIYEDELVNRNIKVLQELIEESEE